MRTLLPAAVASRLFPRFLATLLALGTSMHAARAADAERDYQALLALRDTPPPATLRRLSDDEGDWLAVRNAELHERGLAYIAAHPTAPRRWDVVMLLSVTPTFTRQVIENGAPRTVRDFERQRVWSQRYLGMVEDVVAAPDASSSAKQRALGHLLRINALNWRKRIRTPEGQVMLRKMEGWFDRFERDYRTSPALINGATALAEVLDTADPARCQVFLLRLQSEYRRDAKPDTAIRAMAEGRLKLLLGQAYPVWIRLFALDGRFADSREYKEKIILIALFPITFSEHAEFLQNLHTAHHKQGFEIIHVTTGLNLDRTAPNLTALDVATLADDRNYPWRVVYDGADRFGDFTRSLGLNGYPIYLLMSRDGRFVAETSSHREVAKAIGVELVVK